MSDVEKIVEKSAKVVDGKKDEFQHLTEECGPHCGAQRTIGGHLTVGHCPCEKLCHGRKNSVFNPGVVA